MHYTIPLYKMKKISDAKCSTIISLLEDGLSSRQIASRLKISHSTVDKIHTVHHPTIQKTKGGRKPRLTANDRRHIARIFRSGEVENAPQIAMKLREETDKDFSHDTITHVLKEVRLEPGDKQEKPRLLAKYKEERSD